ncbi:MAG: histidine--tRNA ligase [Candidatus Krumholzibacteria bacterium]|nr:histidine--tRNA ligase [Candidatus Krumholzibacteria bacterium]
MNFQRPRGTRDLTPDRSSLWRHLRSTFERVGDRYAYVQVDTPVFERTGLFSRSVGEDTDVVSKEMYSFLDRKGRELSLRPEGTAPVVRMVLENGLLGPGGILRLSYLGPMFRYDRPQAGRYRQFSQFGVEAFGSTAPALDAEVIGIFVDTLRELGLKKPVVELGSVGDDCCRPDYLEKVLRPALQDLGDQLCATCRDRAASNPMRVFDCKIASCQEALQSAPRPLHSLCGDCASHQEELESLLEKMGIDYHRNHSLVRGLDYYTRTVFEVHDSSLGAQSALGGGGRYDRLVEQLGGAPTPAVGFSSGIDRLELLLQELNRENPPAPRSGAYLVLLCPRGEATAERYARMLRDLFPVEIDWTARGMKAQLKTANAREARFALILGEDELEKKVLTVKDLDSGEQVTLAEEDLMDFLRTVVDSRNEEQKQD